MRWPQGLNTVNEQNNRLEDLCCPFFEETTQRKPVPGLACRIDLKMMDSNNQQSGSKNTSTLSIMVEDVPDPLCKPAAIATGSFAVTLLTTPHKKCGAPIVGQQITSSICVLPGPDGQSSKWRSLSVHADTEMGATLLLGARGHGVFSNVALARYLRNYWQGRQGAFRSGLSTQGSWRVLGTL